MNRFAAFTVLALVACHRTQTEPAQAEKGASTPKEHGDEEQHEELPRLVKLSPEVIRDARVRTASARKQRLTATVELNGQIVPDPGAYAIIGARTSGRLDRVLVREGDRVRARQAIAVISSPEVGKLRGELAGVSAKAAAARRNATRLRELFGQRLGSEQEAIAAEADATAAEAERDALSRTLRGLGATVGAGPDSSAVVLSSPVDGSVVQLDASLGQMVEPSHNVAIVADLARVWFQAQVFEKDLPRVAEGAAAEVRLNGYPDHVFTAHVSRISGQVDPQARTVTARLALRDPDRTLRLGLFGTARISVPGEVQGEQIVVPFSAVTEIGDVKAVFVRHPDGDFELHEVRLGESAGGLVAVISGLKDGEEVAVSGVHTLKSAVLKATMEEEE
ncbi:MAG TPA: efflux RND transporter periplasmic adaptor subunit [Myxococcales bacterium]|nr:efflux RND transporter periplasmic adaptor subunit [Myxococcales bacterium]